jgi:hypothetical protein
VANIFACVQFVGSAKASFGTAHTAGTHFSVFFFSFSYAQCVTDLSASDDESSLGESSHGASTSAMLQGHNSAAALIQKQFRKSFPQRSSSSLMLEPSSATAIALSAFRAKSDVTEIIDHESDEDFTEHSEEEEVAKEEHRSGRALWGIAAIAGTFIGVTMIGGVLGGPPVDEDDAIAVVTIVKGGAGGGGGGAGGTGGGGAGGGGAGGASAQ